jgi:hypothetical protein
VTHDREAGSVTVLVDACSGRTGGGIADIMGLLPRLLHEPRIGSAAAVVEPGAAVAETLAGTGVDVRQRSLGPSGLAGRLLRQP